MTTETTPTEVTAEAAAYAAKLWQDANPSIKTMHDLAFTLNWAAKNDTPPADLKELIAAAATAVQSAEKAIEAVRRAAADYWHRPCRLTATDPALINATLVRRVADERCWYPHPTPRGLWVTADSGQSLTAAALLASGDLVTEPGA